MGHTRCIAYWTSTNECAVFEKVFRKICKNHFGVRAITASITEERTPNQRRTALREFSADDASRIRTLRLICSVRILDEGVDIPRCDSIFLSRVPRSVGCLEHRCLLRMLQRVSRSTRLHEEKTEAGIYVWTDDDTALTNAFRLLRHEDPRFASRVRVLGVDYDRACQQESIVREEIQTGAVQERIAGVEALTLDEVLERKLALLQVFVAEHDRMPKTTEKYEGVSLGQWINTQRTTRDKMPAERRTRLEGVPGWVWDVFEAEFERNIALLQAFTEERGRIPKATEKYEGVALGMWVVNQRATRDKMPAKRRTRLEAIPGWVWRAREAKFDWNMTLLQLFVAEHGRVPKATEQYEDVALGRWVVKQRATRDTMPAERRTRLEAIPGWVWDARIGR